MTFTTGANVSGTSSRPAQPKPSFEFVLCVLVMAVAAKVAVWASTSMFPDASMNKPLPSLREKNASPLNDHAAPNVSPAVENEALSESVNSIGFAKSFTGATTILFVELL